MRSTWIIVALALVGLSATPALGEGAAVGDDAPEISATAWLNTEGGESPLGGDADPKLILLEFWGTWCGPCVRSMPKIQGLWDRYRTRRLMVVAITREAPGEVRGFLKDHGYTMPVACDPSQACIAQFGIDGWPTSVLIDRDGKIVWRGSPYAVEPEIEKGLGLESSPTTLLANWLDACAADDDAKARETLERLVEKAPGDFDLRAFAETTLGGPPEGETAAKRIKAKAALKLLEKLRKDWGDAERRAPHLTALATAEVEPVDLATWVGEVFRDEYPFKKDELETLLAEKQYDKIIDMFVLRGPSSSVYKAASKDDGLTAWCDKQSQDTWTRARKARMSRMYWMSDEPPPEGFDDEAFSRDLSISGVMMNEDQNAILGVIIAGDRVTKEGADTYVARQLARFYVMNAIAGGDAFKPSKLRDKVESEDEKIEKALRAKYG